MGDPRLNAALWAPLVPAGRKRPFFSAAASAPRMSAARPLPDLGRSERRAVFQVLRARERKDMPKDKLKVVRKELEHIRETSGAIYVLNDIKRDKMWSYPSGQATRLLSEKIYHYPDMAVLGGLAEESKTDLRVVVLLRDVWDSYISGEKKAGYGKRTNRQFDKYAAVFVHNYRAMAAQLSRLDPSFIRCIDYATLPRLPAGFEEWIGFSASFGAPNGLNLQRLVQKLYRKSGKPKTRPNLPPFWVTAVEAAYADFRRVCPADDNIHV